MPAVMSALGAMAADMGYVSLMILMARITLHSIKFFRRVL